MLKQHIQSALLRIWTTIFPHWENKNVTVAAVGEGRKIVCLSGPFFPVFSEIPYKWVEFEEYPQNRFTTFREDLIPGMKIDVELAFTSEGKVLDCEV